MSEFESLLHRSDPSAWELIMMRGPCLLLADGLYSCHRLRLRSLRAAAATLRRFHLNGAEGEEQKQDPVSVVCISDTHNNQIPIPDADILIHAGDLTQSGSLAELQAAVAWLREQPHRYKIVIAGNHDILLDPDCDYNHPTKLAPNDLDGRALRRRLRDQGRLQIDWGDVQYIRDRSTCISMKGRHGWRRLQVYGSPWSPRNGNWAFQYARADGKGAWNREVPDGTDILVTHGPPRGHLDLNGRLGCEGLLREVWRVRPALHVFGHVHEGYGQEWVPFDAVQRAYEQTISEGGGFWNLFKVVWAFGASLFSSSPQLAKCQMVNAAMVGGLRDEVWRRPIKVDI
ncbi:Metallo-dependent phosphatase-like protein [Apiospora hydei]|uniref:Metallo-dependent phosphatase-like protein n=1 Tax=Apiospora hydei TaxID=1337664 RepID=A0ABR1VNE9_9PEZI